MGQFQLHYHNVLQGDFELKKINFLLVFQVNCPGCFLHAIPICNTLMENPKNSNIQFLGLSTAFEDFEYNTEANTRRLIETKEVVGETLKAMQQQGYDNYPNPINFPIAMDLAADKDFDFSESALLICKDHPRFIASDSETKALIYKNVLDFLKKQQYVSLTFTLNQLNGTPSFIVFDDKMKILAHWFGHKHEEQIQQLLDKINS